MSPQQERREAGDLQVRVPMEIVIFAWRVLGDLRGLPRARNGQVRKRRNSLQVPPQLVVACEGILQHRRAPAEARI